MWRLEPRPAPSRAWTWGSPLLALSITVLIGVMLFVVLGKDPVRGLSAFFWEPVRSAYALGELSIKATPLLLIALGLAVCFRSNVWNIGAEGQFIIGAGSSARCCWPACWAAWPGRPSRPFCATASTPARSWSA